MRMLLLPLLPLLLLVSAPPAQAAAPQRVPAVSAAATRDLAPARADFDAWVAGGHAAAFARFERLLVDQGVAGVLPPWTLWYQGTDWKKLGLPAYAEPPEAAWTQIVPTLRLVRDVVVPAVGPVQVRSGFRTPDYNARAGGASRSQHLDFTGLDLVPERAWTRADLHASLVATHGVHGAGRRMGLGLYSGLRFHVDTARHRRW